MKISVVEPPLELDTEHDTPLCLSCHLNPPMMSRFLILRGLCFPWFLIMHDHRSPSLGWDDVGLVWSLVFLRLCICKRRSRGVVRIWYLRCTRCRGVGSGVKHDWIRAHFRGPCGIHRRCRISVRRLVEAGWRWRQIVSGTVIIHLRIGIARRRVRRVFLPATGSSHNGLCIEGIIIFVVVILEISRFSVRLRYSIFARVARGIRE
jgi:hypothetical protein